MKDIIIEEIVEKIVEEKPPVTSEQNVLDTPEFKKQMSDFFYEVDGEDIIVTGLKFEKTTLKIPMGVTKIGKGAFSNQNLKTKHCKNIILPKSVYEIEEKAFYNSYFLRSIDMQNSSVLKIGKHAFTNSQYLNSVKLPPCLNEIGDYAFARGGFAQKQMQIIVPKHTKVGTDVFDEKTTVTYGLEDVAIAQIEQRFAQQTENRQSEFDGKKTSTKQEQDQSDKEIINELKKEKKALESELAKLKKQLKQAESKVVETTYAPNEIMTCDNSIHVLFKNVKNIKKLVLNDFAKIKASQLKKFKSLEVVEFNQFSTDLEIGESCFEPVKSTLKGVKIEAKNYDVTVKDYAFNWCTKLEYFDFSNVVFVGMYAFNNCIRLKKIRFGKIKEIRISAFDSCENLEVLDLSEKTNTACVYSYAFKYCPKLTKVLTNPNVKCEL